MTIFKKNKEEKLAEIDFTVHKFSSRDKPDPSQVLIISCFSEFGCEVVGAMYCISRVKADNPGMYVIVMGWYGREFLYKHQVDEFWEMKENCQWLRDYSLAFHHKSHNLKRIEQKAAKFGRVIKADALGRIAVGNQCQNPKCRHFWGQVENVTNCPKCKSNQFIGSLFSDVKKWRGYAQHIPKPSGSKLEAAKKLLGNNPVAIIARNRATYGRNLPPGFYKKLIYLLRHLKYDPIWLGEKQTTLECPVHDVVDFSRMPEARDMELTLAIISQCKFSVQFWTASTRLSAIMGVPYLVFESPDQVYGDGQEAYRLALCTMGNKKLALCHYLKVLNDQDGALNLVERCINEMEKNDWRDVIGLVDEPEIVAKMRNQNIKRMGGI